jgi:hypothetical protein
MSTQYRLVQSGKTASGGCSAGQGSSEPVAPRIFFMTYMSWIALYVTVIDENVLSAVLLHRMYLEC